jgi:hypothetical protein
MIFWIIAFLLLAVNALVMWSCCAINRENSLSRSATHAAPSRREPDSEKGESQTVAIFRTGR